MRLNRKKEKNNAKSYTHDKIQKSRLAFQFPVFKNALKFLAPSEISISEVILIFSFIGCNCDISKANLSNRTTASKSVFSLYMFAFPTFLYLYINWFLS